MGWCMIKCLFILGIALFMVRATETVASQNINFDFFSPVLPAGQSWRSEKNIANFADVLRFIHPFQPIIPNDPSLTAVTREFGSTIISTLHLPFRSEVAVGEPKPWSSWWY